MSILNLQPVQNFLKEHSNHESGERPTAVFDCDGTVIKGDVGEAMFYYQIEHFLFKVSPASVWPDHPRRAELDELYHQLKSASADARTSHPAYVPFAAILLSWYAGQIAEGKVEKSCADIVRLFAGYSLPEVRQIAEVSFNEELASPLTTRILGGRSYPKGIRYIKEAVELLQELQQRGFQIWAVSGSNKWSVEPVFKRLGYGPDRVIGIEMEEENGILTPRAKSPVPIREHKVQALQGYTAAVPVLSASDSRNDIPLFLYSKGLKVRINSRKRDTDEFFREGQIARDESWVLIEEPTIEEKTHTWQT